MELILQQSLQHQQEAIDRIATVFDGLLLSMPTNYYENPSLPKDKHSFKEKISEIQKGIPVEYRNTVTDNDYLNLDVKMETGTGKTYVYTKTMFELHKRYGFNKFIIVVPSLAIKSGTAQFLKDDYARRHFSDNCGYGTEIEVGVLEASKNTKKGRSYFPYVIDDFIRGSSQNSRKIHVLLLNMQLLTSAKVLTRDDYDYGPEGFYRPLDALRAIKPIVIIDETHRFARTQKAFKVIEDEIKPQCIIRFGATFPEEVSGRGKNKIITRDYQNLLYDLNACESFNQGLIKGVAKEHFEAPSNRPEKIKITSIDSKDAVHLQYKKKDSTTKSFTLKTGDALSIISDAFEGITITAIGQSFVQFSNGIEKTTGEEIDVDIYMTSYQEQMLKLAIQRHFETEKQNFCGRNYKIKTLALFFIDDITSYRATDGGKKPYLLQSFESLLRNHLEKEIATLDEHDHEYKEYLQASLDDISACHAGYFSQDNSDSDEEIAAEVDAILNGKKELLSFKNEKGEWNTRRFLFSKWTLKEGWDNPNIFTIAKLRSSGSENSKLQEVGRGLRLPVDENGNRISNEDFELNYIVDFTEADFATKLVEQINSEIPQASSIGEDMLQKVAKQRNITADELFDELYEKKYIDRHYNIRLENRDSFLSEYPEFTTGLGIGKVKDRNIEKPEPIKIRKAAYNEIKELWERINHRYFLYYDKDLDLDIEAVVKDIFRNKNVFTEVVVQSKRERIVASTEGMSLQESTGVQYTTERVLPYNVFLNRIMTSTNIPIKVLHNALLSVSKEIAGFNDSYINESSVTAFCAEFQEWKNESLQGRFHYKRSKASLGATALTYADGTVREEIPQGRIGIKMEPGTPSDKYLYDSYAYDSPLEKNNIMSEIDEVIVYGKIPRRSIAIPTTTGGMYSPDFMYVVKHKSGAKELNLIIETKDVENKNDLRGVEKARIECAKVFFEMLSKDGYTVHFRDQLGNKQMVQIIKEVMSIG